MASVSFTPAPLASGVSGISQIISPSFAGMGIEPSNLFSFTGFEEPNTLSINCFNNLANITGIPPYLRLGGNTADYMIWDSLYTEYNLQPNPKPTGQGAYASDSIFFGPKYFEALNRFPTGMPVTFGLNLAYEGTAYGGYINRIVKEAEAARTMMTNVHLQAFEIGNEPDLYLQNGFRSGDWSGTIYGQQWAERAQAVWQNVLKPAGLPSNFFEPGATASTIGTSFMIEDLVNTDITMDAMGSTAGFINAWSQHDYYYYISVSTYALTLDIMMDLSTTITQFEAWTSQVKQAKANGKPYVLREMADVGPVGQVGISDTFGAALWTLNFFLYTAGLDITSVEFHMTDTSYASPWQPLAMDIFTTQPHVRSSYAAWIAMAELIGPNCNTQVIGLPIKAYPTGYEGRLATYNTYQDGKLAALVMINTLQRNATQTKSEVEFTFHLPDLANEVFYLAYLNAPGADSTIGTTFNGINYQLTMDGTPELVNENVDSVRVASDGTATFKVRDSQAIVANRGSVLGSNRDTSGSACSSLGRAAAAVQATSASHAVTATTAGTASSPTGVNNYNVNGVASGVSATQATGAAVPLRAAPVGKAAAIGALIAGAAAFA